MFSALVKPDFSVQATDFLHAYKYNVQNKKAQKNSEETEQQAREFVHIVRYQYRFFTEQLVVIGKKDCRALLTLTSFMSKQVK